jgi:hypothetical protein
MTIKYSPIIDISKAVAFNKKAVPFIHPLNDTNAPSPKLLFCTFICFEYRLSF